VGSLFSRRDEQIHRKKPAPVFGRAVCAALVAHRLSPEANDDLDAIVSSIANSGGNLRIAEKIIFSIFERFFLLASYPYLGKARDVDLGEGRRSYIVGNYVIVYRIDDGDVLILRVIHARRDIESLLR
jgi:toxin ParE1/3/4